MTKNNGTPVNGTTADGSRPRPRLQLVYDAVVAAYINDISERPERQPRRSVNPEPATAGACLS